MNTMLTIVLTSTIDVFGLRIITVELLTFELATPLFKRVGLATKLAPLKFESPTFFLYLNIFLDCTRINDPRGRPTFRLADESITIRPIMRGPVLLVVLIRFMI